MKKSKLIPVDQLMEFRSTKKTHQWYWDHKHLYIKDTGVIIINYGYAAEELPEELIVNFIYLDTSKKPLPSEHVVSHKISIPSARKYDGKSELPPIVFKVQDGKKLLWKIAFRAKTKKLKTYLHYSLGDPALFNSK